METRKRKRNDVSGDSVSKKPHVVINDIELEEDDLLEYLKRNGFPPDICKVFEDNKITFDHLSHINGDHLSKMGINTVGTQINLLKCLSKRITPIHSQGDGKVFNDPIHGHIELHPLLINIIDTPQFQRLRYIKQLGGGYFVFPGASHNRFEHSIGVAYLAGEFVENISRCQPELYISPSDVLCVKIAGLCHDLGHGPFSHMFDGDFIPKATGSKEWKHEQGSVQMFDHLIDCNDLRPLLFQNGLTDNDLIFIKELIVGPEPNSSGDIQCSPSTSSSWPYHGRPVDKSFLYEIVANKRTGIDVDKWDYFARDCHCLGIPNNFDWKRYTKFARVIKVNNTFQICCRDKEVTNLYEMFHTRASLHRRAYKHKTAKIVELMITEALLKADDHIFISGKDNQPVKMSQAIHDPYAYTNLNDSIIFIILQSTKPELDSSKAILDKLHKRQLYKCIGQTQPSTDALFKSDNIEKVICEQIINSSTPVKGGCNLTVDDIIVKVVSFDYGMGAKNPIDEMRFYTKQNPNHAVKVRRDQVSQMLPQTFIEKTIRVYSKKMDKPSLRTARSCFAQWCADQGGLKGVFEDNEGLEEVVEELQFTPYGTPFGTPMKFGEGSEEVETAVGRRNSGGTGEKAKRKLY